MKIKFIPVAIILLLVGSTLYGVEVDGLLSPGEYSSEAVYDKGSFRLLWEIAGDRIYMAIDSSAQGWVSIGFDPTRVMANSDMIFGIVPPEGEVQAVDAWSTGMFGPHPPDLNQGGKNDILSFAGKRNAGRVVFEFSRLLDTGDKYDKILPTSGDLKIIWAYASSLQFTAKHSRAGSATISMSTTK
jgi:hypothetical protein